MTTATKIKLTEMETEVVTWLNENHVIDDSDFSETSVSDVSKGTGIETKILRGVISSLIKKEIIYIELFDWNNCHEELIYFWE